MRYAHIRCHVWIAQADATCCLLALSYDLVAKSLGCLPIRSVAVGGAPTALPASPPLPFVPPAAPFPASGWVRFLIPIFNRVIRLTSCPRTARRLQKKTKSCRDAPTVCALWVCVPPNTRSIPGPNPALTYLRQISAHT